MMYSVDWLALALSQLADLWNYAPDRKIITDAANRIDRYLQWNPDTLGVPYQNHRVFFVMPLSVTYDVDHQLGRVEILEVKRVSQ